MEKYKCYTIIRDNTGFAPKDSEFAFYLDSENVLGSGKSIEECKKEIDSIIIEDIKEKLEYNFGWENLDCKDKKWFVDELILDIHKICISN